MKSNAASKSDTARMVSEISEAWGVEVPRLKTAMVHQIAGDAELIIGQGLAALKVSGKYVPFLSDPDMLEKFPAVTVDMGAVAFVCKGANIMRPGITEFGQYEAGQLVTVVDEKQRKFLAVGAATVSSAEAQGMKSGQAVDTIHYISDRYWEAAKSL